ncbi:MAG: hypothetical protein RIQ81_613 [Pseudomonadota bacterium]|jgi:hypothetical protein
MRVPLRFALPFLGLLATIHLTAIVAASTNLPLMDEWEMLAPGGLDRTLNWRWVFAAHNEHRIVFTKLITWVLYKANGWHHVANLVFNFFLYILTIAAFLFLLRTIKQSSAGLQKKGIGFDEIGWATLALSGLAWENHSWGFQNQFHLFLLFFFLGSAFAIRGPDKLQIWLAASLAICSAWSFSSGVVCALAIAALIAWRGIVGSLAWRKITPQLILILAAITLWVAGFQKNPGHPAYSWPTGNHFWGHFLTMLGSGWGLKSVLKVPVAAVVLGLVLFQLSLVAMSLIKSNKSNSRKQHQQWLGAILFTCSGLIATAALTSLARGQFGREQAESSRYTEFTFFLLPLAWTIFTSGPKEGFRSHINTRQAWIIKAIIGLLLVWSFAPYYDYRKVYQWHSDQMAAGRKCVATFYAQNTAATASCSTLYLAPIEAQLLRARELNLAFTAEYGINQGVTP